MTARKAPAPPARTHPYMLLRGDPDNPAYFRSLPAAQKRIRDDLLRISARFRVLGYREGRDRVDEVLTRKIPRLAGQKMDELIDPELGVRYRAEIVRREKMS